PRAQARHERGRRGVVLGLLADAGRQLAQPFETLAQRRIGRELRLELEAFRRIELAVCVSIQQPGGFFGLHFSACTREASVMTRTDSVSSRRARARRDITVPIGTSAMRAISR